MIQNLMDTLATGMPFAKMVQSFIIIVMWIFLSSSDEQERVQKKTFTNWMNTYLKQVGNLKHLAKPSCEKVREYDLEMPH